MPIRIACPNCKMTGRLPEGFSKPRARCPRCGTIVPVAQPAEVAAGTLDEETATLPMDDLGLALEDPLRNLEASSSADTVSLAPLAPEPSEPALNEEAADRDWLQEERQRLEDTMSRHFAQLREQREEFAGWRTQVEAGLLAREQELHRLQKQLAHRAAAQRQAPEAAPPPPPTEAAGAAATQALEQTLAQLRQECADQQTQRERLQLELQQLQQTTDRARGEWRSLEDTIRKRKQSWEAEEARWQGQIKTLQDRQAVVSKAEQNLQRRQAEIKGLEKQIYVELEKREQQLARDRQELDQRKQEPPGALQEKEQLRRKIAQTTREYENTLKQERQGHEQRRLELEQLGQENEGLRHKLTQLSRELERLRTQLAYYQAPRPPADKPRKTK